MAGNSSLIMKDHLAQTEQKEKTKLKFKNVPISAEASRQELNAPSPKFLPQYHNNSQRLANAVVLNALWQQIRENLKQMTLLHVLQSLGKITNVTLPNSSLKRICDYNEEGLDDLAETKSFCHPPMKLKNDDTYSRKRRHLNPDFEVYRDLQDLSQPKQLLINEEEFTEEKAKMVKIITKIMRNSKKIYNHKLQFTITWKRKKV
jgi:hypothetical protein